MHTKGKLKYLRSKKKHKDDLFLYTDAHNLPDGFIGKLYGFGIHDETANAQRLVKCWNEYDSLKAKADVCDELVELLKDTWEFLLVPATHHGGQTCIISASQMKIQRDKIEQALAKAERIE